MLKWFIAFMLALALIGWFTPLLAPQSASGGCRATSTLSRNGREYSFPFASSLLLSALVTWLMYAFR